MSDKQHYGLYYPSIEFADPNWLWASALIWDRIYRIVPRDYTPEDSDSVKRLSESGEIGAPIHPDEYAPDVAKTFIEKLRTEHWDAAALSHNDDDEYARLHHDKVDVQLREMIVAQSRAASREKWFYVPTEFEAHYMTYLARHISEKNGLNLVTDVAPAWTGSTYFAFDGLVRDYPTEDLPFVLASIVVRDFIPSNILGVPPEQLLAFRDRYRDERHRFVGAIQKAAADIANCHDAKVAKDMFEDLQKDIVASTDDFRRSIEILKVQGWTGMKTIVFPAATAVIGKLISLDPSQLFVLSATGLAMGAVSGLAAMKQKGKRLSKAHEYSYLLHLRRLWKQCYRDADWNYYLCRQMEEFIND
jgi:hypothetical protein